MIAPRTISRDLKIEDGSIVEKAQFAFEVQLYGHYYKENFFVAKESFLVACQNNIVSMVSVKAKGLIKGNLDQGRVEFMSDIETLHKLIEYQRTQRLKGTFVHSKPLDQWL